MELENAFSIHKNGTKTFFFFFLNAKEMSFTGSRLYCSRHYANANISSFFLFFKVCWAWWTAVSSLKKLFSQRKFSFSPISHLVFKGAFIFKKKKICTLHFGYFSCTLCQQFFIFSVSVGCYPNTLH